MFSSPLLKSISKPKVLLGIAFVLIIIGVFSHNHVVGLRAEEPRRAMVGIETLEFDSWLIPTIHGETYYNKPPFYNWVLAASFSLFDSYKEWAVRFPGALSFLLTGLLVFLLLRRYSSKKGAMIAAACYLSAADLLFYGSVNAGEIDLFYSFLTLLQVYSFFHFAQQQKWWQAFLISYVLCFIGLLTKGIPSLAFQALTILAYLLIEGRWKKLFSLAHITGILLLSGLTAYYLYEYSLQEDLGAYLTNQFKESSQRTANEFPLSKIALQLINFPLQILQLIMPWGLLVFLINKKALKQLRANPLLWFSMIFLASNIWLYWISPEMRNRYLYMFLPPLVMLFTEAYRLRDKQDKIKRVLQQIFKYASALIVLAFILFPFLRYVNEDLQPAGYSVIFGLACLPFAIVAFKKPKLSLFTLVVCMAIARLGFNFVWLPHFHEESRISDYYVHSDKIAKMVGEKDLYWTGEPFVFRPDVQLFGEAVYQNQIETPPLLPYSIPYRLISEHNRLLPYAKKPLAGAFYLGEKSFALSLNGNIHYEFRDKWMQRDLVLYSVE